MSDNPHIRGKRVGRLDYTMRCRDGIAYNNPPTVTHETDSARYSLTAGVLTVVPTVNFLTVEEARHEVEKFLRAWEAQAVLTRGTGELRFDFAGAAYEPIWNATANPNESRGFSETVLGDMVLVASGTTDEIRRSTYPKASDHFSMNEDVQTLLARFIEYRTGRQPLTTMGNWIKTWVENRIPKKRANRLRLAAEAIGVDESILRKLGDLCQNRGDPLTGRKVVQGQRPLSELEERWIREAVGSIIRAVGDTRPVGQRPPVTMASLPPL